jgi:hypothetical protein
MHACMAGAAQIDLQKERDGRSNAAGMIGLSGGARAARGR